MPKINTPGQASSQKFASGGGGGGGGLEAESPALQNFAFFFCKNNNFRVILIKIMLWKRSIEIGRANMIKLVA